MASIVEYIPVLPCQATLYLREKYFGCKVLVIQKGNRSNIFQQVSILRLKIHETCSKWEDKTAWMQLDARLSHWCGTIVHSSPLLMHCWLTAMETLRLYCPASLCCSPSLKKSNNCELRRSGVFLLKQLKIFHKLSVHQPQVADNWRVFILLWRTLTDLVWCHSWCRAPAPPTACPSEQRASSVYDDRIWPPLGDKNSCKVIVPWDRLLAFELQHFPSATTTRTNDDDGYRRKKQQREHGVRSTEEGLWCQEDHFIPIHYLQRRKQQHF